MYTAKEIYEGLKNCIGDNEDFMMHLSFKSMGQLENGFDSFFEALSHRSGTSMFAGFSYSTVTADNPVFDLDNTPVCVGAFPEWFRKQKGVLRSIHPTHSICAYGADAEKYVSGHENDITPVGYNSPLMKLTRGEGKVLFLGCGPGPNTTMHGVEELIGTPYVLKENMTTYHFIANGKEWDKAYYPHNFNNDKGHFNQRYARLENLMPIEKKPFLDTFIHIIPSAQLLEVASKKIKENPFYFVDVPR